MQMEKKAKLAYSWCTEYELLYDLKFWRENPPVIIKMLFKSRNTSERIAKPRELAPTIFLTCLQLIAEISGVV